MLNRFPHESVRTLRTMKLKKLLLSFTLLIMTLCVYWQTGTHGFCLLDDGDYIANNPAVLNGISPEGIAWAFSSFHTGNWHPVTWLSHMLDVQVFGRNSSAYHFVNVTIHSLNAMLVFLLLVQLTAALWRSFLVALLFALHPLHVESVAWIAERKDLLSGLFFFLTLIVWGRYVKKQTITRYLCALSLFALGLMAKPMLVTLPFILILLDWWPLGRLDAQRCPVRLFVEKIPFLGLSLASSCVTLLAQHQAGAMATLAATPLSVRLANALISYGVYLRKMVWSSDLAIIYPLPTFIPWWQPAAWGILFIVATFAFLRMRTRHPYLIIGWLWYLGMLLPVIGIIQVGIQSMADRYTYLPLLGPFVMISWGAADMAAGASRKAAIVAAFAVVTGFIVVVTWRQTGLWKSNILLFSRAVEVASVNPFARMDLAKAHINEGIGLIEKGNYDEALRNFSSATRSTGPVAAMAHNYIGLIHAMQGKDADAFREYVISLKCSSTYADPYYNMGLLHYGNGRFKEAAACFSEAVRLKPEEEKARAYLRETLQRLEGDESVRERQKGQVNLPQ